MEQGAEIGEFKVEGAYRYNRRSPGRWLLSHLERYWYFVLIIAVSVIVIEAATSEAAVRVGQAVEEVLTPSGQNLLGSLALWILGLLVLQGLADLVVNFFVEILAQNMEVNARDELYSALLSKSQAFHDRQRVGDIMARATDDVRQLNFMISPGLNFTLRTILGLTVPLIFLAQIDSRLLLVPGAFVLAYGVTVRRYLRKLSPVMAAQREQYGAMSAVLEETISGIEIVKATAQEGAERGKFFQNAKAVRDYVVQVGYIEARYLPLLLFTLALGLSFLHAAALFRAGQIGLAEVVAVMGLVGQLQFPVFISVFSFSLVQMGLKSAGRLLEIIKAEVEMDQNRQGHAASMQGEIVFEDVSFDYGDDKPVLHGISFRIEPGQTVAIVGQTGSGKSTLTDLINRTYDATAGQVRIDGVDVRAWNLDALRSQISRIEQDVFLFSRPIAENIAFGAPGATREQVERAAQQAQAHGFITGFKDGYETEVGDRGVQLSGGQRQRIALARAFLSDPRVLILDDSTSAIDSATEDEIQRAIREIQQGRTTILITHRLSQIRWADVILVLDQGRLAAAGDHAHLLRTSEHYRRIFARYEADLPPLEPAVGH